MSSRWGWWGCSTGKGAAGGGEKACGKGGSLPSAAAAGHKERRGRGPFPLRAPLPSPSGGEALLEMLLARSPAEGRGGCANGKGAQSPGAPSPQPQVVRAEKTRLPAASSAAPSKSASDRGGCEVEFWFCPRLALGS